ncbi:hypothetical protein [Sinimarinibacterium thermocellulolyticum]|uniref:Lipoprotein n=1 Tax=Sinimarinibacterium thermocellulolyticum TaxID=3170016 RepID=A0ABV2A7N8_9GAMM
MNKAMRQLAALAVSAVVISGCAAGSGPQPPIDEGPPPELRSYAVRGSADKLPLIQVEQIDSRSNDGRFRIEWEVGGARAYAADLYVSEDPYPPLFSFSDAQGDVRISSLYCWVGDPDCRLRHVLNCRFDPHNVLQCDGQGAVDLTHWLGELPRKVWLVLEACNRQADATRCAANAVEVEFR